jgi:hypothetical protein
VEPQLVPPRVEDGHDSILNAWDSQQTGLERNQFNYCLNYKPKRPEADGCIWLVQVRCNVQRIATVYPKVRDALRLELRRLEKVCPKLFVYRENEQTVELRYTFNFDRPLKTFPDFISPKFQKLIEAAHPILVDAVDLFHRCPASFARARGAVGQTPPRNPKRLERVFRLAKRRNEKDHP